METSRIIINSMLGEISALREGIILDTFEEMDNIDIVNTHRKRKVIADGVITAAKESVTQRIKIYESIDKIFSSEDSLAKKLTKLENVVNIALNAVTANGYIVGKYSNMNEILDDFSNTLLKHEEKKRNANKEAYAKLDEIKKELIKKAFDASEKACGPIEKDSPFAKFKERFLK